MGIDRRYWRSHFLACAPAARFDVLRHTTSLCKGPRAKLTNGTARLTDLIWHVVLVSSVWCSAWPQQGHSRQSDKSQTSTQAPDARSRCTSMHEQFKLNFNLRLLSSLVRTDCNLSSHQVPGQGGPKRQEPRLQCPAEQKRLLGRASVSPLESGWTQERTRGELSRSTESVESSIIGQIRIVQANALNCRGKDTYRRERIAGSPRRRLRQLSLIGLGAAPLHASIWRFLGIGVQRARIYMSGVRSLSALRPVTA